MRLEEWQPHFTGGFRLAEPGQTGEEAMSLWYAVLIKADSEEEAFAKATQRGKEEEGDDDGTFRSGDKPAQWLFAGIRKLTLCEDPEKRPGDGTEVSYTELEVESEQAVWKLLEGKPVAVQFRDPFADRQGRDGSVIQAR
jgi:hypothetical protein